MKYVKALGVWVIIFFTDVYANVPAVTSTVNTIYKKDTTFLVAANDKIKKTLHAKHKKKKNAKKVRYPKVKKHKKLLHKRKHKRKHKHKHKHKKLHVFKAGDEDNISLDLEMIPDDKEVREERKKIVQAERRRRAKRIKEERMIAIRLKEVAEDMRKFKVEQLPLAETKEVKKIK